MFKQVKKLWTKKAPLAAALLCMALVVAGCSSSDNSASGTKKKVIIGSSMALSGSAGAMGLSFEKAMKMAVEDLNASSTKYEFYLDSLDDMGTVPTLTTNIDRLMGETKFLTGAIMAAQGAIASKAAVDNNLLFIASLNTDPAAFKAAPNNMFSGVGPADVQGKLIAEYMVKQNYKKVAILAAKTQYGKDSATAATEVFKSKGVTIVYADEIASGATDVRSYATKVKDSGADAVYTINYSDVSSALAKTLAEINYKVALIGGSSVQSESYLKLAGANAEGTVAFTEAPADNWQKGIDFNTNFEKKYSEKPYSPFANYAVYDTIMMLGQAIEKAGPDDVAKVADQLKKITYDGAGGPGLQYSGNLLQKVHGFMKVSGGKWVRAE